MPGFLYYIPNRTEGIKADEIAALGLGYAIERAVRKVSVLRGPDGGQGVLIVNAATVPAELTAYRAGEQNWRKIPGSENWVGIYRDPSLAPGPQSLARPKQLAGHFVTLLDENAWLAPVARGWAEEDGELRWYHTLPRRSELAEDGSWKPGGIVEQYARLWNLALRWLKAESEAAAAAIAGGASGDTVEVSFDFSGIHQSAIEALAENYYLGPAEAALMGLLSAAACRDVLDALVDGPTLRAWLEKKTASAAAGSSTAAGEAGATETIAPPSPTSGPSA